jgi:flagellin-like hook-associated protein FlgL
VSNPSRASIASVASVPSSQSAPSQASATSRPSIASAGSTSSVPSVPQLSNAPPSPVTTTTITLSGNIDSANLPANQTFTFTLPPQVVISDTNGNPFLNISYRIDNDVVEYVASRQSTLVSGSESATVISETTAIFTLDGAGNPVAVPGHALTDNALFQPIAVPSNANIGSPVRVVIDFSHITIAPGPNTFTKVVSTQSASPVNASAIFTTTSVTAAGLNASLVDETSHKVTQALSQLRSAESTLGANSTVLQIRKEFTKNYVTGLQTGSDRLTLADLNEEGANLSTMQTRQQLGTVSLSISTKNEQGLLRLF